MRLDKAIVVVNEYTYIDKKTGRGTRGSTPQRYVINYVAREAAVESDVFIPSKNIGDYVTDYTARESATEAITPEDMGLDKTVTQHSHSHSYQTYKVKKTQKPRDKYDGVLFSHDSLSLTHQEMLERADQLEQAFLDGKTVLKTVLSFHTDYLKSLGVIDEDFTFEKRGDFRGHIDQVRLRQAIQDGVNAMARYYDDLQFTCAIQVDTEHVHCHLTMCDMGVGNVIKDGPYKGLQKGKLSKENMRILRRRVDSSLDETKSVAFLASHADLNQRHLKIMMARDIQEHASEYSVSQKLFSVLPADQKSWSYKTKNGMNAAHSICREYIASVLNSKPDEKEALMQSFRSYVDKCRELDHLSEKQCDDLMQKCETNFYNECENVIYKCLRQIPKEYRNHTMDPLSLSSNEELVNSGLQDVQSFVFRYKSYASRYDTHKHKARRYDNFIKEYTEHQKLNNADDPSKVLYDFFIFEREYQMKMVSKYSQMLFAEEPDDDLIDEYTGLMSRSQTLTNMRLLQRDPDVNRYKSTESLCEYARARYDIDNVNFVSLLRTKPERYDEIVTQDEIDYNESYAAFVRELNLRSKAITTNENGILQVVRHSAYDFDDVRGLDLHDVRYDFGKTLQFDGEVRLSFMDCAEKRLELYDKACKYLEDSNQAGSIFQLFDVDDFERMRSVYETLKNNEPIVNNTDSAIPIEIEHRSTLEVDNVISQDLFKDVMDNIVKIREKYKNYDGHDDIIIE